LAGHVVLPAVVGATQAVLLVAAEPEGNAAVGAELVDQAETVGSVAEGDQALGQELHPHGRAVGLGQLLGEQRRQPVAAEQLAHRRAGAGTDQQFILFRAHVPLLRTQFFHMDKVYSLSRRDESSDSTPPTKRNPPVARNTGTEPSAAPTPPNISGTPICVTLFAMMRMPSASPERPLGAWLYVRMMVSGCAEPRASPSVNAARPSRTASCSAGRKA